MKDKIILKSVDLFLSYGFKSVTMDDIANALGMSKKTIYQHFNNKTKLVESTTLYIQKVISEGISKICSLNKNPIEEIYAIKHFVSDHLKNEKSSPQFQLKKYYPNIYKSIKGHQFELMYRCIQTNINRGVQLGIYRKNMNIDFITRLYFNCVMAIKDDDLFPLKTFSKTMLVENYLEYHLRGICTNKGIQMFNVISKKHNS
ncbi:MAG: TetR/AcrR family transcriptional regulator [Flavobacteriaceae bacterium]|jgi:TetR/AcrR family transcriptional regulator, cholesterol catabolism regulator|nr:TetR/AcrR family transcriptional regulator [Bacteroidota bacterium]MDB2471132.1 TetR/AcrR family transcriptional regulator [Flavobacteriaceae bacterium]MDC0956652.1 TetR/AcrR family transcriptional regulator [Flavobacteriaceae bacterium]MDG1379397.1 TetR/AcrR family transcriptional regulator [Flavobacteriaceae bacterium]MDG2350281.1 TetR/AcrR family transcriptional regulator [Flavobacteriaceae bacterium]|tara:strand:- start:283 stop:888 length:606 start_codon:yes stop_codon:yes gene_type:complete